MKTKQHIEANRKAWVSANKDKIREMSRRYYLKAKSNPEYIQKKHERYLAKAKKISEENKKKRAEYRASHPIVRKTKEHFVERDRIWREKNRESLNARQREWTAKNKVHLSAYKKEYYNKRLSLNVQYSRLFASAKDRKHEATILFEDFKEIVSRPCAYCGENNLRRGIDRIDNLIGYTKENSAPCCKICNYMKKTLSLQDFLSHINKIYIYNERK